MPDPSDPARPLPDALLPLLSVAAARVDPQGKLIEANAGFLRLIPPALAGQPRPDVRGCFIQPGYDVLLSQPSTDGLAYQGLITLGDSHGTTTGLKGRVTRSAAGLCLIAEHDVQALERIYVASLEQLATLSENDRQLARSNRSIRELSLTDPLTGIANRRRLDDHLPREIERARRHSRPLCVAMCDIDFFKKVNDRFGHQMGDVVLVRVAGLLAGHMRQTDFVARYGGEEFGIVLPETRLPEACRLLDRIRATIEATRFDKAELRLTASFGVTESTASATPDGLWQAADAALYRAKLQGRNRVEMEAPGGAAAQPDDAAAEDQPAAGP